MLLESYVVQGACPFGMAYQGAPILTFPARGRDYCFGSSTPILRLRCSSLRTNGGGTWLRMLGRAPIPFALSCVEGLGMGCLGALAHLGWPYPGALHPPAGGRDGGKGLLFWVLVAVRRLAYLGWFAWVCLPMDDGLAPSFDFAALGGSSSVRPEAVAQDARYWEPVLSPSTRLRTGPSTRL